MGFRHFSIEERVEKVLAEMKEAGKSLKATISRRNR